MKKKSIIMAIMLLSSSFAGYSASRFLNYDSGGTNQLDRIPMPRRDVVTLSDESIEVTYTFYGALLTEDDVFPRTYWWKIVGFGFTETPAEAAVPFRKDSFIVPKGKVAYVTVEECERKVFQYSLTPARVPMPDLQGYSYTWSNVRQIDTKDELLPESPVEFSSLDTYRDNTLFNVNVYPISYNSEDKQVHAVQKLKYKVSFVDADADGGEYMVQEPPETSIDDRICQVPFWLRMSGSGGSAGGETPGESGGGSGTDPDITLAQICRRADRTYLVMTVDSLLQSAEEFIKWKRMQGYNVVVESSPSWTYKTAKAKVDETFNEYPDLYHLLIIGGHKEVPGKYVKSGLDLKENYHLTDYYFSFPGEKTEKISDISVGRIPFSTVSECKDVLSKIVYYQKTPFITSRTINVAGATCFENDNKGKGEKTRYTLTTEEVLSYIEKNTEQDIKRIYYSKENPEYWNNTLYSTGASIPDYLKKPDFAWNGSAADIQASITTDKTSMIIYRGESDYARWHSPYFYASHLKGLSNTYFPFVFSISCSVGRYDKQCLAKDFLKDSRNRSVGVIAASSNCYSGYADAFLEGMIDAMWPNPGLIPQFGPLAESGNATETPAGLTCIGDIFIQGQNRMAETYGVNNSVFRLHNQEVFHIFGDPSMSIHTEKLKRASDYSTVKLVGDDETPGGLLHNLTFSVDEPTYIGLYNTKTGETQRYYGKGSYGMRVDNVEDWIVTVYNSNTVPYIVKKNDDFIRPIHPDPIPIPAPGIGLLAVDSSKAYCRANVTESDLLTTNYELELRNSYGAVVSRTHCETGVGDYSIDISELSGGIYVVSLSLEGNVVDSKHFVK